MSANPLVLVAFLALTRRHNFAALFGLIAFTTFAVIYVRTFSACMISINVHTSVDGFIVLHNNGFDGPIAALRVGVDENVVLIHVVEGDRICDVVDIHDGVVHRLDFVHNIKSSTLRWSRRSFARVHVDVNVWNRCLAVTICGFSYALRVAHFVARRASIAQVVVKNKTCGTSWLDRLVDEVNRWLRRWRPGCWIGKRITLIPNLISSRRTTGRRSSAFAILHDASSGTAESNLTAKTRRLEFKTRLALKRRLHASSANFLVADGASEIFNDAFLAA